MPVIDFEAGYRDSTNGATLKALQQRRIDMQGQIEKAMQPRRVGSWTQGAAQVAESLSGVIRENRAANQEAAGRKRFAELLAGGLSPDEIGEAMNLDAETTMKYKEHDWAKEATQDARAEAERIALRERGWSVEDAATRVKEKMDEENRAAGREEKIDTREYGQTIDTEKRTAEADAKKAERDAVLRTSQGERAAAVAAGTMTPEKAAELNQLDEDKIKADIASSAPDEWRPPTPEEAVKQGGDVGKHPGDYSYNAKTGEFKPIAKARSSTDITNIGKFETSLAETRSAKVALNKALELAPNIMEGGGVPFDIPGLDKVGLGKGSFNALERANAVLQLPSWTPGITPEIIKQAQDTKAYFNIMNEEAIKAMGIALTGASSNFEMQEFQAIMADPGTPLDVKIQQVQRMLAKLDTYEQIQTKQVMESGGDPGTGQTAASPPPATTTAPPPPAGDPLAEARAAIAKGAPRDAVIKRLQEKGIDPAGL